MFYFGIINKTVHVQANLEALPPNAPSYLRAAVGPPSVSARRHFCSVCGYIAPYTCPRCGARFCCARCQTLHNDTRCQKFLAWCIVTLPNCTFYLALLLESAGHWGGSIWHGLLRSVAFYKRVSGNLILRLDCMPMVKSLGSKVYVGVDMFSCLLLPRVLCFLLVQQQEALQVSDHLSEVSKLNLQRTPLCFIVSGRGHKLFVPLRLPCLVTMMIFPIADRKRYSFFKLLNYPHPASYP